MDIVDGIYDLILDDGAVGNRIYENHVVPVGETFPYVVIHDYVGDMEALIGDRKTLARERTLYVELWQELDSLDRSLVDRIRQAIERKTLNSQVSPKTFRTRVSSINAIPEEGENIIHHTFITHVEYATENM